MVIEDRLIDQMSEWRNFSAEASSHSADPNRVGGPRDEYMKGSGMDLILQDPKSSRRLPHWPQSYPQEAADKTLGKGFHLIKDFVEMLRLPESIAECSKSIFACIVEKKKLKGRNMKSVVGATVYVAAKQCGNPRNIKGKSLCEL